MSVFISYRRDSGRSTAEAVYRALCGEYDVFLDTESLKNGYFDSAIKEQIENCDDFIVIVNETLFDRCSEPEDWILNEAAIALKMKKNIIPIFVGIEKFPANVPKPLEGICRYNGIFWNDEIITCQKIKAFLVSNRQHIVSVVRSGDRLVLHDDTKKELIELYKKFSQKGRSPVKIKLNVSADDNIYELLLRQSVVEECGLDFAQNLAKEDLRKREEYLNNVLETAVEFMLQDEMLDACAYRLRQYYIDKIGIAGCSVTDEAGGRIPIWTPLLWFDIIEELLKEYVFKMGRQYFYGNSRDYVGIDCFVETQGGKTIWSFVSHVKIKPEDECYLRLAENLRMPLWRGDYFDLPLHDLAFNVYPDLYYNIGLLKAGRTARSFENVSSYKDVFNLWHYFFGLH